MTRVISERVGTWRLGRDRFLPDIVAGVIVGVVLAVSAVAYAGLIYSGPLSPGLLVGVAAVLGATAIGVIVITMRAGAAGIIGAPYGALAVIYGLLPGRLSFVHPGLADPVAAARIVMVVCALVSIFTGLVFWLLGRFRLAEFARFLPYPVVAGYIAAVGWLFVVGGFDVGVGPDPEGILMHRLIAGEITPRVLAPFVFGGVAIVLARRWRHWAAVPGVLVISIAGFHVFRLLRGVTIGQAVAAGWLLGPFRPGSILTMPAWDVVGRINAQMLHAIVPVALSIVLVGSITTIMSNAGLEVQLDTTLDGDREMETAGIATLISGFFGGIIVAQHIPSTVLARRMGSRGRIAGVVAGLCCGACLFAGTETLNLLPRFVVGGLLIFNGLDLMLDRLWTTRGFLSVAEWSVVLLVLATVIISGFLSAVVMGLALALVIFVLNYRRVPVIALSANGATHRSLVQRRPGAEAILRERGEAIRVIRLQGYLFFLNAHQLVASMPPEGTRFLILDFRAVPGIDSSAATTLWSIFRIARERGYAVICTGLTDAVRAQFSMQRLPTTSDPAFASCTTETQALQQAEETLLGMFMEGGNGEEEVSLTGLMREVIGRDIPDDWLVGNLDTKRFASGEVLVREGDRSRTMVFIRRGRVSIEVQGPSGTNLTVAVAVPGVVIGELSFYTGEPVTATVRAVTETEGILITPETLASMAREAPDLGRHFHDFMVHLLARKLMSSTQRQVQERH